MKVIISSTYDDKYLYFIPIVTFCWNKLGVDVICFMPHLTADYDNNKKFDLLMKTKRDNGLNFYCYEFNAPEHKEATYAQCSRLYAACLDLPEDEILITGDVDMVMFKLPFYINNITIFGSDLVPDGQYPICYASGTVKDWRTSMQLDGKTYQQCLDELLGSIECENMRGNYWSKDQQELWQNTKSTATLIGRARPNTQFAENRIDRDDSFWEERLNHNIIDAHLWRPGYTEENFEKILKLLKYFYPDEDFNWLISYTNEYRKLL